MHCSENYHKFEVTLEHPQILNRFKWKLAVLQNKFDIYGIGNPSETWLSETGTSSVRIEVPSLALRADSFLVHNSNAKLHYLAYLTITCRKFDFDGFWRHTFLWRVELTLSVLKFFKGIENKWNFVLPCFKGKSLKMFWAIFERQKERKRNIMN